MTKLLSYYNLCPINNFSEFLGISKDADPGSVINTLGKNIILIIKLNNQKQIKSWTVLDRLTNKVIYDFNRKQYVGVFANRFLRFWDDKDEDINKIKKVKYHRKIHDLITVEFDNRKDTLVLYQDGTCESLDSSLESRLSDKTNEEVRKLFNEPHLNYSIENVEILELPHDRNQLLISYSKKYRDLVELNYTTIEKETLKPNRAFKTIKLDRLDQNVNLCGFSVVEGSERYPSLLSIWSDKRVFMQTLKYDDNATTNNTLGNFIAMIDIINVTQPMSIIGINRDVIAIYAANKNSDGSYVLLYNFKFKVVQSKQYFKIYFKESRIWSIDSNIFLAFGRNLSVIPYHVSEEQLSDMVGSQCDQEILTLVDNTINEDLEFEEKAEFCEKQPENDQEDDFLFKPQKNGVKNKKPQKNPHKKKEEEKITKFESSDDINEHLHSILRDDISFDLIRDENQIPGFVQAKLFSRIDEDLLVLSDNFEFLLMEMQRYGCSEIEITDKVLPVLIKTNRTRDIGLLLKRFNHISERMLVKTLKYLINCPEVEKQKAELPQDISVQEQEVQVKEHKPFPYKKIFAWEKFETGVVDVLNILLSCSFDAKIITKYLRQEIELNELIHLMDYLYGILTESSMDSVGSSDISSTPAEFEDFDMDKKLFDWFTILIDSHYQQILLTKDEVLLKKLIEWNKLVEQHIKILKDMIEFRSLLLHVTNGKYSKLISKTKSNKWYSIEKIKLY